MDYDTITKLILAAIPSLGTIALVNYNFSQSKKAQAELIEKFDIALSKSNKHTVSELFRLIHGFRMNYEDIITLVKDDNCSKIILALKKNPSQVKFQNGKFIYFKNRNNKILKKISALYNRFTSYFCAAGMLISFFLVPFAKPSEYPLIFFGIMLCALGVIFGLREYNFEKMIDDLVGNSEEKTELTKRIKK